MNSKIESFESADLSLTELIKMASQTKETIQKIGEIIEITNTCLKNGLELAEGGAPYSHCVLNDLKSMASCIKTMTEQVEQISTLSIATLTGSMNKMVKGFQKQVITEALTVAEKPDFSITTSEYDGFSPP